MPPGRDPDPSQVVGRPRPLRSVFSATALPISTRQLEHPRTPKCHLLMLISWMGLNPLNSHLHSPIYFAVYLALPHAHVRTLMHIVALNTTSIWVAIIYTLAVAQRAPPTWRGCTSCRFLPLSLSFSLLSLPRSDANLLLYCVSDLWHLPLNTEMRNASNV